jgi:hypothetical protein
MKRDHLIEPRYADMAAEDTQIGKLERDAIELNSGLCTFPFISESRTMRAVALVWECGGFLDFGPRRHGRGHFLRARHRLKAALRHGDVFDREGLDRLGEALDSLLAEVAQPEQVADQAAGDAGEYDLPGFRKSLQARREVGGLADHRLLLRRAFADQIADDDKPGGNADSGLQRNGRLTNQSLI